MGDNGRATPKGAADKKVKDNSKKEIKILMLHGYTQSGTLFRAKTRALEKLVAKSLAPFKLAPVLIYPTAPNRLSPRDIPGFTPAATDDNDEHPASTGGTEPETDAWAWFRKDEAAGQYRLLREGFDAIADAIRGASGIDGVIGFSQGGAMAALLAAALEVDAEGKPARQAPAADEDYDWSWVEAVRSANGGRPLRFAVVYSGFFATPAPLGWLYEPAVGTPTLQYIGSLDTVVEESRSRALVARCKDPVVLVHPGGHYVPVNREWVMPLASFIKQHCESTEAAS
ncbi:Dihydrofolate reductase [Pleurostoma richardsiae]|uniref:Dihydrofolate reductase n=1 Tax=Pleurostoma richardsiae TaxID=41990 RepID=A0AA38S953_9PEZI|nr:Dihydrofolate reductase [Pleurostoma richardsiae]